jgi:hypothetical protein
VVRYFPRPRWNYNKANWKAFSVKLDKAIRFINPSIKNYGFTKLILSTAKFYIPRGFRKENIPGWSRECEDLADTANDTSADLLLNSLDQSRRKKWVNTVENLNFTHSSRNAWALLRKLSTGESTNNP